MQYPSKKNQSMRVFYGVAMLNPSHIDMVISINDQLKLVVDGKELASKIHIQDTAYQIENYHIKPPTKTGMDLLNYIIKFRKNNKKSDGKSISHLNVEMTEIQEVILNPSDNEMAIGSLLKNDVIKGARMKIAERRLTSTGKFEIFDSLTNDDDRLSRLENDQILTAFLAEISRTEQANMYKNIRFDP